MGSLKSFIDKTGNRVFDGVEYFIETGTGYGSTVDYARNFVKEENIYSVEIDEETHKRCIEKFKNTKINLRCQQSIDFLKSVVLEGKCLYWLDAHFPGEFRVGYGAEPDLDKRYPLEKELEVLSKQKNITKSVILIDDLRIYVDASYENRAWLERKAYKAPEGVDFVNRLFSETHSIQFFLCDDGYLLLVPKE